MVVAVVEVVVVSAAAVFVVAAAEVQLESEYWSTEHPKIIVILKNRSNRLIILFILELQLTPVKIVEVKIEQRWFVLFVDHAVAVESVKAQNFAIAAK